MRANSPEAKLGLSIHELMELTGLSKQTLYHEINSGRLKTFKVGRRRLASPRAAQAWVQKLEKKAAGGGGR